VIDSSRKPIFENTAEILKILDFTILVITVYSSKNDREVKNNEKSFSFLNTAKSTVSDNQHKTSRPQHVAGQTLNVGSHLQNDSHYSATKTSPGASN